MLPKLYKKDSHGSVREWEVHVEDDEVVVTHGLQGGQKIVNRTRCVAKNVGRANATTPQEQALAEAQSKWNKQVDRERYSDDVSADNSGAFLAPMLARDYSKVGHQLDWVHGVFGQCKYDGHRGIWDNSADILWSRKGTPITATQEAIEQIRDLSHKLGVNLDGELYLHGLTLRQISSAVKKRNELTPDIRFVLFDVAEENLPYEERRRILESVDLSGYTHLDLAKTVVIRDQQAVKAVHDAFVSDGYEGLILRESQAHYAFGQRAKGLMKYKEFLESEFLITDVVPDVHGKQGILQCVTPEGKTFGCRSRGKDSYREFLLGQKAQFIGLMATVRYFEMTEYGIPVFPVCVEIGRLG